MNLICENDKCTGCGACKSVCPKGAIKMYEKAVTGHFFPVIDEKLCVDCGLCKKVCPSNNVETFVEPEKVYAAWRKEASKQTGSSSGGVAAALYEEALANDYYVVGTYADEDFMPKMKVTNDISDVESFKGSKYVQADTGSVYEDIKQVIAQGNKVLFIGTPCQCSAARSIVKNQDNLVTVDLICHGVPSQKVLKDYFSWIEQWKHKKITKMSFRSEYGVEMTLASKGKVFWKRRINEDYYLSAFNSGLMHNETCYQCRFAKRERAADITIGDFWGIGKAMPFEAPGRKVSVIAVNTEKGSQLLQSCNSLELVEREYDEAVDGNTQLRHPSTIHKHRDTFWKVYNEKGIEQAFYRTIYDEVTKRYKKNYLKRAPKEFIKRILRRK